VKSLKAQIDNFGLKILAEYDAVTQAAMGAAEATLASEQAALAADNKNLQDSLTAHTKNAIEIIIAAREALQTALDEAQTAQEEQDEEACEVLKVALVTTKNSLWKDVSWLTRKQYAAAGYGHGRHGKGYGKHH
jgi:ribosomal protein L7/L12